MKNWVLEIIEDSILSSLESSSWLPERFTVSIPDEAWLDFTANLVYLDDKEPVQDKTKRVNMILQDCRVTIRSDSDPEELLPVAREEVYN